MTIVMNINDAGCVAGKRSIFTAVFCGGVKRRLKDATC